MIHLYLDVYLNIQISKNNIIRSKGYMRERGDDYVTSKSVIKDLC